MDFRNKNQAQGFQWTEEPVLDFGRVKIPVTRIVEKRLREQQNEFTTIIDEQIKEKFDLKPYLLELWNQFSLPMNLSEEFNTWLKITRTRLYDTDEDLFKLHHCEHWFGFIFRNLYRTFSNSYSFCCRVFQISN